MRLNNLIPGSCTSFGSAAHLLSHVVPQSAAAVKPSVRGASRFVTHAVQESSAADSDSASETVRRRRRLFRAGNSRQDGSSTPGSSSSSSSSPTKAASDPVAPPAKRQTVSTKRQEPPGISKDVLEDFAAAFESLAVAPKTRPPSQPARSRGDGEDLSYLSRDRTLRSERDGRGRSDGSRSSSSNSKRDARTGLFGRTSSSGSYGSITNKGGSGWGGRGKQKGKNGPMTLEELEDIDEEDLSPAKRKLLEELRAEAAEAEARRLRRKERSERIPTAPKKTQDPILFQAITREWDEKMSLEERRGARAAARKVARVGLYDRNRAMKAIRRKVVNKLKVADEDELTEEERIIAQRAIEIREAAAAKSIQRSKEELAEEAKGVGRSYARAEALPEGLWEELKEKYRSEVPQIKIGRRGATPSLISSVQQMWRNFEVVKLRIHDDKSARKMNLPRLNLLLRELEEMSGGVLIDAQGTSIWLYRGVDWTPPPPPPVYKPPPAEDLLQQDYTPKGSWQDIGGVTCYVVSSRSSSDGRSSSNGDGSSGSESIQPAATDAMTLLMLPDHFSFVDSKPMLQVADWFARKGALVVLADVLGAQPGEVHSNIKKQGEAPAGYKGTHYWPAHRWPLVKKRKLEYMEWYQTGPGSWQQQRPKLLQLLEAMQQQGLYDTDAEVVYSSSTADANTDSDSDTDAAAAGESEQEQQQQVQQDGAEASSNSSSSSSSSQPQATAAGRPLGLVGMGWGTFIGLHAAGDDAVVAAGVQVFAALSPACYNRDYDLTCKLQLPVALLPAKYDNMEQVMMFINLLAKPWELRCIFKRFGKVKPGWASWLPQWSDARAMRAVSEQLLTAVSWLRRELLGVQDGYVLPEPQLPATAGAASQADLDKAAAKLEKQAAADLAEAEADAQRN